MEIGGDKDIPEIGKLVVTCSLSWLMVSVKLQKAFFPKKAPTLF
jgi:hypothetical protein